jgi:hypothetical protein
MALLNAAELLRDDETKQDLEIKGIRMKKTDEPVSITITLKTSRAIVKEFKKIRDQNTTIKSVLKTKGKKKGDLELNSQVDHESFCKEILDLAFEDATGDLIDEYSIDIIMAATERFPRLLETLSSALLDFFETGGKFISKEEAEDEKN